VLPNRIPIGKPLDNVQLYILDKQLEPVRPDVLGEIFIGGRGVSQGYLNRPDLTAERFLPDPFSSAPGARLFRTGDFGRYRAGGVVEFAGRQDRQIKLRGFRIELDEIELALRNCDGVAEAAISLSQDKSGGRVIAYVVTESGDSAASASRLRTSLEAQLPHYMIPSNFVFIDGLPKTRSGKIDRPALTAMQPSCQGEAATSITPVSATERRLADMWRELLNVESIDSDVSFFELGGHSLLATQLASRIRQEFKVELPLRDVFDTPTVRALAGAIELAAQHTISTDVASIPRLNRSARTPM
jgi:acyl carrier protein